MEVHRLLHLDDLHDSRARRVVLDDLPICLAKVNGEPLAIGDTCPHDGLSLADGVIAAGSVTCPSQHCRFDLSDGSGLDGTGRSVTVYPTRLTADGWVEVEVPDTTLLSPARALET